MEELEVEIGTSCHETWEEMTTTGCNRHCAACDKVIHDLEQMTGGDAAALLESGEEVCVRAQISANGRVKLADNGTTRPIRVGTAALGAAASLALGACSFFETPREPNGFEITGLTDENQIGKSVRLIGQGIDETQRIGEDRSCKFVGLQPGTYKLYDAGECSVQRVTITISEPSAFVSAPNYGDGPVNCFGHFLGMMKPADPPERA